LFITQYPGEPRNLLIAMNRTIEVLPDKAALIQRSLELTLAKIQTAIQERGYVQSPCWWQHTQTLVMKRLQLNSYP
jgi:hypothetical protein